MNALSVRLKEMNTALVLAATEKEELLSLLKRLESRAEEANNVPALRTELEYLNKQKEKTSDDLRSLLSSVKFYPNICY